MTRIFDSLNFGPHPAGMGGTRATIEFPNGYGASVITGAMFYTDEEHPYELGVTDECGLTYETPITSDVEGHLNEDEVEDLLVRIAALPKKRKAVDASQTLFDRVVELEQEAIRLKDRVNALESFLARVKSSMDYYTPEDVFIFEGSTTIQEAITAIINTPEARGERPLLEIPA